VQPSLAGQAIRCPNVVCGKIFTVPAHLRVSEDSASRIQAAKVSTPNNGQQSGSVGEMVPILPAEQASRAETAETSKHVSDMLPVVPVEPAEGNWWQAPPMARQTPARPAAVPPPAPPEPPAEATAGNAPWWGNAPPPVRTPQARTEPPAKNTPAPRRESPAEPVSRTLAKPAKIPPARAAAETQKMPAPLLPPPPEQPRELPPGVWEPPPVRRGTEAAEEAQTHAPVTAETDVPRVSKRRAWKFILIMSVVVFGILGGAGWWIYQTVQNSEEVRFAQAKSEYQQGQYGSAASKLHELVERFPASPHAEEYRFLEVWSNLCSGLTDAETNLPAALDKFDSFIKDHKKDPFMAQYSHDAGQIILKLTQTFAQANANPSNDQPLVVAQHIEQLRRTIEDFGPETLTKADSGQIDANLDKVRTAVARWRERQEVLSQLDPRRGKGPIDAIKHARILLQQKDRVSPGFSQDAEIQAALTRLYAAHLASVVYKPRAEEIPSQDKQDREDEGKSLLFAPPLRTAAHSPPSHDDPIVLALARGVLYALKQSTGDLKWATRVGIDTTVLPQRVPASAASRERLLVLSADTQTLTARDTKGNFLWEYHVGQPVLGRPVLIEQRAYLAAYDGSVHEIELSEGQLLGRYSLGQRLTCGGTREGDTKRIYFPADDSCIYVLDVEQRRCAIILYDGHPSGSLRSEPIIIPPEKRAALPDEEDAPGYLILNQRNGLDAMQLRVFQLPLQDAHAAPLVLKTPAQLAGWTWFEPKQDGEKLAVLSDAGMLGLFGIRQLGNQDQALFPLLQPGGLDLSPFLGSPREDRRQRGRSQVVHMRDEDLWILAHGRLQQVQLLSNFEKGPLAVAGWKTPLLLGSPLHAPQRIEDRAGRSTFFLVTQPLDQQTCIASAVNDEGHILWQRQLGLVCQGEPLALTPPQGGPPTFLALDQSGGLFALNPPRPPDKPRSSWESLEPALPDNPRVPPRLLPSADGHSAYEIAAPGDGKNLIVRQIDWDEGSSRFRVKRREVSLMPSAGGALLVPAGAPIVTGSHLLVPMSEGYLARVPLPLPEEPARFDPGPDWRSRQASPDAPCHVLALGDDRILATDGSRGLAVWTWPANKAWQALPEGRDRPSMTLPHLVAAPPILLPKAGLPPRIAVADSARMLYLLTMTADGSLQQNRKWDLKGKLTSGPFVQMLPDGGVRIGCVLDQRHLVWLDPTRDKPLWTYQTDGEAIVGQPQVIGNMLVVAHQSGHYVALDPASGEAKGKGYTLRASAAPAATPVSFGPQQMLAPLSDGTALLLSLKLLSDPKP